MSLVSVEFDQETLAMLDNTLMSTAAVFNAAGSGGTADKTPTCLPPHLHLKIRSPSFFFYADKLSININKTLL